MSDRNEKNTHHERPRKITKYIVKIDRSIYSLVNNFENVPIFGRLLKIIWHGSRTIAGSIYFFLKSISMFFSGLSNRNVKVDQDTVHWISPECINYVSHADEKLRRRKGSIFPGNWDQLNVRFDDLDVFLAFRQVLLEQKNWEDTTYYQECILKIKQGDSLFGCTTEKEFLDLCNYYRLYYHNDYLHSLALNDGNKNFSYEKKILVDIGRFGDLLLHEGEQHLAAAKILGVEKIPVQISLRHSKWMRFRNQYELLAIGRGSKAYQPSLHIDLIHIPAQQGSVERFEIIKSSLSIDHGRLLDLGANLGYFSIMSEKEGFECVAVENSPRFSFCLKGLKRAINGNFQVITESLLDSSEIVNKPFEVILALNIFHHLLKNKENFDKLGTFLEQLHCKEMYFEPHLFEDPQMANAYINLHENEFAEFVRTKLNLSKSELIGVASDNRPIYKIS